tara:strand:- start:743 stop:1339 length:597 start_codon:yes stop_codon:yes gene_type:complete
MKKTNKHIDNFFSEFKILSDLVDKDEINNLVNNIKKIKDSNGRLFFLGVGGSAANSSHAVNDFRKICEIECYAPTDNVAELTARINDEGWDNSLAEWLRVSNIQKNDAVFVMSVGGGNLKKKVSVNLINAIKYAKKRKSKIFGIVGRDGGFAKKLGDAVIVVPLINKKLVTPYTEAFHSVIWHCLVSHPLLQLNKTKW